jgi:hypothetical protein
MKLDTNATPRRNPVEGSGVSVAPDAVVTSKVAEARLSEASPSTPPSRP